MALKIFKGVWFFSLVVLVGLFFYIYAGLPEQVLFFEAENGYSISRDGFFYLTIFLFAIVNALVFAVSKLLNNSINGFTSWFYGLVITFNFFFMASLGFLHVLNGGDRYDYSQMAPTIYGSLILIGVWILGWPLYLVFKKIAKTL